MTGETDNLKGRVKEAAGALTDDDDLKNEGKADQAAGSAKDKVGKVADWADDKIDQAKDKFADKG
ncbi:CsbD family protein [Gaiella sp.]|uniref:CsbD family protein n=1 Tax=Gaiella sp. TaxID=2663207 RepID=UPI003262F898